MREAVDGRRGGSGRLDCARWILVALACLVTVATQAQNATWSPGSSDWNTGSNWSTSTVPGNNDTATFDTAPITTVTFSSLTNTNISTLSFTAIAPAYSFHLTGTGNTLRIGGIGIVNNSAFSPTFTNDTGGETNFANASVAANATIMTNNGGNTTFSEISNAANATITMSNGGNVIFTNNASAGNATISTTGGGTQSATFFQLSSTAGNASITTNAGGFTVFQDTSTGGQPPS
jgi:fibronectin-binding autotransporter adhesin